MSRSAGRCELVRDHVKAKQLWKPVYDTWFPKGIDDPNLILLKVQVQAADYWHTDEDPHGEAVRLREPATVVAASGSAERLGADGGQQVPGMQSGSSDLTRSRNLSGLSASNQVCIVFRLVSSRTP